MRDWPRYLFLLVGIVAGALAITWWINRPPAAWGARTNHVFRPPGNIGETVPAFSYGAYHFDDDDHSIAYFVRVDDPKAISSPMPWLEERDGRVYVKGRRVMPRRGVIQMFVADGLEDPHLVILSDSDRQVFYDFLNSSQGFDGCVQFWNGVLRKNYFPDLQEEAEELPLRLQP